MEEGGPDHDQAHPRLREWLEVTLGPLLGFRRDKTGWGGPRGGGRGRGLGGAGLGAGL